jgi:DNA-binding HxlR family transcriptional regulator
VFPYGLVPGAALETNGPAIRRALEVLGLRWNLLILKEVFTGAHRFQELQSNLDIPRKMLARRLKMLVAHDVLERHRYEERPDRYEYSPTEKGRDLYPALLALIAWGERHMTAEPAER